MIGMASTCDKHLEPRFPVFSCTFTDHLPVPCFAGQREFEHGSIIAEVVRGIISFSECALIISQRRYCFVYSTLERFTIYLSSLLHRQKLVARVIPITVMAQKLIGDS